MTAMIELVEAYKFADAKLRNDVPFMASIPGGLYRRVNTKLPEDAFPEDLYCLYQRMAGTDERAGGGIRLGSEDLFLFQIVGPASKSSDIATAAGLMDGLVEGASGTTASGIIYYFQRQGDFDLDEVINANLVWHLGGYYRTFVQGV